MYLNCPLLDPHTRSCLREAVTEVEYFSLLFQVSQNMQFVLMSAVVHLRYVYACTRITLSLQKHSSRGCSAKKVFPEILQNSQENT